MNSGTSPTPLRPGLLLTCAVYVRVSSALQAEGYSPDVQRAACLTLAAQLGYTVGLAEEDHVTGSKVTRAGYQRIIEAVRAGTVHAVLVYRFDRFGREGTEWLTRVREFERLGVPIISVQEGRDEAGLMRYMRAGLAEEYSRQLAKRVRPAKAASARAGVHQGMSPLGYTRVYPAYEGGRRPHGHLVADPVWSWVIRELFERYAAGVESYRSLADWLKGDARVPAHPNGTAWTVDHVRTILHNCTYAGRVGWGAEPRGLYERTPPGEAFTAPGLHEGLITDALFAQVQALLATRRWREPTTRVGTPAPLLQGLLVCPGCGGPMVRDVNAPRQRAWYRCGRRLTRASADCPERGHRIDLTHAALLREIARLQVHPWSSAVERAIRGGGGSGGTGDARAREQAATARALETERERLRRHTRRLVDMDDEPSPEQRAAWREVSAELSARIRALESAATTHTRREAPVSSLRATHARYAERRPAAVVAGLLDKGKLPEVRTYLASLITRVHVVERVPDSPRMKGQWLRVAVTWAPDVAALLEVGAFTLLPEEPAPAYVTWGERRNAKRRQERATRRLGAVSCGGVGGVC